MTSRSDENFQSDFFDAELVNSFRNLSGTGQTNFNLARHSNFREEIAMTPTGEVFQPELIELMRSVLDDATAMLPEAKRTSAMKAEIASNILTCAAKGERNLATLKTAALSAIVECTHYSHDISPERRAV
jgi:hypothetical protein